MDPLRRLSSSVLAFLFIGCAALLTPTVSVPPSESPKATAPLTGEPPSTPDSSPALMAGVDVSPDIEVVYAGADATMWVSAFIEGGKAGPSGPLTVASATVDYGDGTSASITHDCASPAQRLEVHHVYRTAADFKLSVTSAELCDSGWQLDLDSGDGVRALAAAPASTAEWPPCTANQLTISGGWTGAGLGNEATLIRLRNRSASGCNLMGYPGLRLVSADHSVLPTHVRHAIDGDYMFPSIAVGRVALRPGDVASFLIGYPGNPFGTAANEPYDVACPLARWIRVTLPNSHEQGVAVVPMAACAGVVNLSPVFPGDQHLDFPGA